MAAVLHDEFLEGRESLVVAGDAWRGTDHDQHALAWIYEVASRMGPELAPSFLIGGSVAGELWHKSFMVRSGSRPFILEGDQYDTAFFE